MYLGDGATEMREYDWSCLDLNHVRDLPVFFRLFSSSRSHPKMCPGRAPQVVNQHRVCAGILRLLGVWN